MVTGLMKIEKIDTKQEGEWVAVNIFLDKTSNNRNRLNSILVKHYVGSSDGGKYKVHASFDWCQLDDDGNPIIEEIMLKVRPEDSFISSMVKESSINFNNSISGKHTFKDQCHEISKSGFVGIVCNYFLENIDKITDFANDFKIASILHLDPQNRLPTNYREKETY